MSLKREMTPEREKMCRQVASLFALTTSAVAGEAQAAKDKVRELVKRETLTFAEVSPFGNEIALKVMRSFWDIAADGARPSPPSVPPSSAQSGRPSPDSPFFYDEADVQEILERLRGFHSSDGAARGQSRSRYPFEGTYNFTFNGGVDWGVRQEPPLSVNWQGSFIPVPELTSYALNALIGDYERCMARQSAMRGEAHDAIDAGKYPEAITLLQSVPFAGPNLPEATYHSLLREKERRQRPGVHPDIRPPRF